MNNYHVIRERYLQDRLPIRLGGLAANLRRIGSFSAQPANGQAVQSLVEESKQFIEWTAQDSEIDTAAELVELQIQLARWQHNWPAEWSDPELRRQMADQARAWSDRVMQLSGLLG
jgi:hypothetical protein